MTTETNPVETKSRFKFLGEVIFCLSTIAYWGLAELAIKIGRAHEVNSPTAIVILSIGFFFLCFAIFKLLGDSFSSSFEVAVLFCLLSFVVALIGHYAWAPILGVLQIPLLWCYLSGCVIWLIASYFFCKSTNEKSEKNQNEE